METKTKKKIVGTILIVVISLTIAIAIATRTLTPLESTNPPTDHKQTNKTVVMKFLFHDDTMRTYWVYVPSSYNGSHHVPLVLALHGAGDYGYFFAITTGWINLSEENNFIVVCPTGSISYPPGFQWNIYNWVDSPDDVGFLMALINQIKSDYLIDPSRIYMTGYSNGASMTNTFAFKHANVLAAIATVSGRWMTTLDVDPYNISQPNSPLPVYIWRGEKETSRAGSQTRDVQDQLQKQYWMDWNNVNKTPTVVVDGIYKTEIYTGGDAEVRFTEIRDRGHDTYDPDTTAKIWYDFFVRFSRG
jgi:polyhydroxybutyrate depolymerase